MNQLLSLFVVFFSLLNVAQADLTLSKQDMESRIHARVNEIVQKVDPYAIIHVNIKLKEIESSLPFLGIDAKITPLDNGDSLGLSSIESISIKILTQAQEFPEWIKKEVRTAVSLDGVKLVLNINKANGVILPPENETAGILKSLNNQLQDSLQSFTPEFSQLKLGFWGILIVLAVFLSLIGLTIHNLSKRMEKSMMRALDEKLVPALSSIQLSDNSAMRRPAAAESSTESSKPIIASAAPSNNEFEELTIPVLKTLLTDCYWTKSDRYAHFIWSQLKPNQRQQLMKSDFIDTAYFSYFREFEKEDLGYHNDAWYLKASDPFQFTNQKDLLEWFRKNPKHKSSISPMRLDFLELSLEERLQTPANTDESSIVPVVVDKQSSKRFLSPQLRIKKLSLEDEDYIFQHASQINTETRRQMPSLAWLALCPIEERKKALDKLDARQLAEAWVGPEAVLQLLREAISEKKLDMLDHFLKTSPADRSSEAYRYLVETGLSLFESTSQESEVKAA